MPQWLLRAVHNGEQRTEFPLTPTLSPLTKGGEGVGVGGSGVPSASDGASPLIAMRGVTKRFGALVACDAVDLQVAAGTLHAIMGENGAGKTTLMRLLYGYYAPDTPRRCRKPAAPSTVSIPTAQCITFAADSPATLSPHR